MRYLKRFNEDLGFDVDISKDGMIDFIKYLSNKSVIILDPSIKFNSIEIHQIYKTGPEHHVRYKLENGMINNFELGKVRDELITLIYNQLKSKMA